jgi:hypothetical protein
LAAAAVLAAATAGAVTGTASPVVAVVASKMPAATAPVQLPPPAAVGQQAEVATTITSTSLAGTIELVVSMTTSVTAVNADGSYTTRSTISTLDVPVGADLAGNGVNNLIAQSFDQTFAASGAADPAASTMINAASMPPDQQASGRALVDAVSMVSVGFPAEPVTVGSTWTSEGTIGAYGEAIPVSYHCTLTGLADSTYTMDLSYAESVSLPNPAGAIEATIAGAGTVTGSVANPLAITASLHQSVDGIQGTAPLDDDVSIVFTGTAITPPG